MPRLFSFRCVKNKLTDSFRFLIFVLIFLASFVYIEVDVDVPSLLTFNEYLTISKCGSFLYTPSKSLCN